MGPEELAALSRKYNENKDRIEALIVAQLRFGVKQTVIADRFGIEKYKVHYIAKCNGLATNYKPRNEK